MSFETTNITGDLRKQSCGRNKKIVWDVFADKTDLKGSIQIEVKIIQTYSTKIVKVPRKRIERGDCGYFGFLIGGFQPMGSFGKRLNYPSDNLEYNGLNIDATCSRTYKRFLGFTSSFRFSISGLDSNDPYATTWSNLGFTIGPIISFPLSYNFVWDLRPMIGYSQTYVHGNSPSSVFFKQNFEWGVNTGAFTSIIGTTLRLNVGHKTNCLLSLDYLATKPKFEEVSITRNIKTLSLSLGLGYRFNYY